MNYPLEGIKVLDFSRVLAGPYAGRMLSDLGADVVKVESPEGDVTRGLGLKRGDLSGYFIQQNIGKRNICIDLKADGAAALIKDLVKVADVVIENYRPGVMDRLGIGWEALSAVNPKLVMLSISGFGQVGPERDRAAYAPVLHMETGLMARQAAVAGHELTDFSVSVADTLSSLHGLVGLLAALRFANETGRGQHVDIGMIDVVHSTDDFASFILDGIWSKETHDGFGRIWEAPEGNKIGIAGHLKGLWHAFSRGDGLTDGAPKGASLDEKVALREQAIADHILSFASFDALTKRLDELRLAWGKVREPGKDAYAQPSVEGRGIFVDVDDGIGGTCRTVQSPYKFSDARSGVAQESRTAVRGEHNLDALSDWLGWTAEEVSQHHSKGVLHDPFNLVETRGQQR